MGNRASSPSKYRRKSPTKAASGVGSVSPNVARNHGTDDDDPLTGAHAMPSDAATDPATFCNPSAEWKLVQTTFEAVDAFHDEPIEELQHAQRRRLEQHAHATSDPTAFFGHHQSADSSLCSNPYHLYNQALMLQVGGSYGAASDVWRQVIASECALADDARAHLVQCLVLLDPSLSSVRTECRTLLQRAQKSRMLDPAVNKVAQELLGHIDMTCGDYTHAVAILEQVDTDSSMIPIQVAYGRHILDPHSSLPPSVEVLLTTAPAGIAVDVQAILSGPQ